MTAAQLKQLLGRALRGYWTNTRPTYAGFFDPVYRPLTRGVWSNLTSRAPSVHYVQHVYDCEDHAMQFRAWVARTQTSRYPNVLEPFCVGLAMGLFSWVGGGRQLHVANFGVLADRSIEWFDLRSSSIRPFATLRRGGLVWVIV